MPTMRAAVCRQAGKVELHEVGRPTPGASEVLVKVSRCGVCGSDLHWYHGILPPPRACPGHEISAVVAELGTGVAGLKAGDRVAIEGFRVCGECRYCQSSDYQRCVRNKMIGGTAPGGFADYMLTAARHAFPLPSGVDDEVAQLTEPLAVSVHALRLAKLESGQRVLVLGAGTIGLMAVAAARAGGAGEVLITAKRPQQQAAARALGADRVFDAGAEQGAAELKDYAAKHDVDVVIETVGDPAPTIPQAIASVRRGGTIVVAGFFLSEPRINAIHLMIREISLKGSLAYGRDGARADFDIALEILAARGELMRRHLITHRFPLASIDDAFHAAGDKTSGSIKVSVRPD
jgi:2-desacetyl-2-hydroxyethyl bacteriochlorophyllide A dehydrogenase